MSGVMCLVLLDMLVGDGLFMSETLSILDLGMKRRVACSRGWLVDSCCLSRDVQVWFLLRTRVIVYRIRFDDHPLNGPPAVHINLNMKQQYLWNYPTVRLSWRMNERR
ncbi:hypothetical protein BJX96DRAFT_7862 [Aspergillus floccosus]